MSEQKQIYTLITKVMADIGAIGKDRKNEKQGYKFRGIDDVYNAANSALSRHGVFSVPTVLEALREERTNANGTVLFYVSLKVKYTFYAPDGSFVEAVIPCEGFDSGDKATNKALSAGQKYAFLQVFCIPTEEQKDSEVDDHEVKPAPKPEQPKETANRSGGKEFKEFNNELQTALSLEHLKEVWGAVVIADRTPKDREELTKTKDKAKGALS